MTREQLKERVRRLPMQPGVYMHKDKTGRVIYVGKAKLLRNRVANYFQPPDFRGIVDSSLQMRSLLCVAVVWILH